MALLGNSVRPWTIREPITPGTYDSIQAQCELVDLDGRQDDLVGTQRVSSVRINLAVGPGDQDNWDVSPNLIEGVIRAPQPLQQLFET